MILRNCALFLLLMVLGYSLVSISPGNAGMTAPTAAELPSPVALQTASGAPAKVSPAYGNNEAIPVSVYMHLHETRFTAVPVSMPAHANGCPG